jgi:hypothetical protein
MLGWNFSRHTGYSKWGFSWFSSAVLSSCRNGTSIRLWPLFSKPFPICHSTIILPFDPVQSQILTTQNEECESSWPSHFNLTVAQVQFPLKSRRLSFTVPISSCGFHRNPFFDPLLHITALVGNFESMISLNIHVMNLKSSWNKSSNNNNNNNNNNNSLPCNRPWRPIGLGDVEASTFSRQSAYRWR